MERLYHYKLWQAELGQYVAQMGRLSADKIRERGGLIIEENECERPRYSAVPVSPGERDHLLS